MPERYAGVLQYIAARCGPLRFVTGGYGTLRCVAVVPYGELRCATLMRYASAFR